MAGFMTLFHQRQSELFDPPPLKRKTDQATGVFGHEINRFRGGMFSQNADITFVFTVFIIDKDEDLAGFGGVNDLFGGRQTLKQCIIHVSGFPGKKQCGQHNGRAYRLQG